MNFCSYLPAELIRLGVSAHSKKKVLETLAGLFAAHAPVEEQTVFERLLEREKLSSTGLGKGIAVPHCRITELDEPLACLLRTATGIDYDAPDGAPVSLFFAVLAPERATDEHLQLLSDLARRLDDTACIERLLRAPDSASVVAELQHATPSAA